MRSLPSSNALAEAGDGSDSLTELLSRDPESYQQQDLDRIVEMFIALSEKWAAAERQSPEGRRTKGATQTNLSLEDLGF